MCAMALPEGWIRKEVKRTSGLSDKIEVYYISPRGDRIKSKMELAKYVGPSVDLSSFDYRTGKINPVLLRKSNKRSSARNGVYDYRSLKNDQSMLVPTRQTASIFKKPVTFIPKKSKSAVYNTQQVKEFCREANITLNEHKLDEKPFQIFWHKRMEKLSAFNTDLEKIENFSLPSYMKPFSSTLSDNDTLLRSVTTALHLNTQAIRGQEINLKKSKKHNPLDEDFIRNPVAFLNITQPLIQPTVITEEYIRNQENAVSEARKKLISAIEQ